MIQRDIYVPSVRRRIWIVATTLGVAAIGSAAVYYNRQRVAEVPRYTVASVTRGDIVHEIRFTGQLSPWTSVEVSSQISGLVIEVNVDFNSVVKKGQVLARIDPSTYEQHLHQAEADLAAADATYKLTALRTRRLKALRDHDLVTQQEYDEAEAQCEQARAALLASKATVADARLNLRRTNIASPIDGVVIFKQVEVGKTVVSSFSAPTLFVISQDLTRMRIIASVSEVDILSVHPDQPVTFTVDAIPDRSFHGRLAQIRSRYTPSERQQPQQLASQSPITSFDAVIEVENPDLLLRPSLTANVSVAIDRREDVLSVPNGALRVQLSHLAALVLVDRHAFKGEGKLEGQTTARVYRLPGGNRRAMPEPVAVRVGTSNGVVTEIVAGLEEGDQVVTGIESREAPEQRRGLL